MAFLKNFINSAPSYQTYHLEVLSLSQHTLIEGCVTCLLLLNTLQVKLNSIKYRPNDDTISLKGESKGSKKLLNNDISISQPSDRNN